jgi:hypothetical protein
MPHDLCVRVTGKPTGSSRARVVSLTPWLLERPTGRDVLEQPEDPTGIFLAFVAMGSHVGPMANLDGGPVAGLEENDAL